MKENDWIVAGLTNPDTSLNEFLISGLNVENTQLLSADLYKQSPFIVNSFTKDGKFDEDAFDDFYRKRTSEFGQLSAYGNRTGEFLYNTFDTRNTDKTLSITPKMDVSIVANPRRDKISLSGLVFEGTLSDRERALQNKIWDSATETWLDESPNDRALFRSPLKWIKNLGQDPLIYATYDEDGTHEDLFTGRMVKHRKGEYKLNQYGMPYTETLNGRSLVGKEVVSAMDILTVDGEGIDRYNFFDSDDLEKSVSGSIAKATAAIAPLFMGPYVAAAYSGILVVRELLKTLPMVYGITTSWFELPESSTLNTIAAYADKFTTSTSDHSKLNMVTVENITNLFTDVATLFGQQRFVALAVNKLRGVRNLELDAKIMAKLSYDTQAATLKAEYEAGKITKTALDRYIGNPEKWWESALGHSYIEKYMKDVRPVLEKSNALGRDAALAYMALVSNTDVYSSMLEHGASRKEAAAVALGSTIGMFGVDKYTHLGELFFDNLTAESERSIRRTITKNIGEWRSKVIDPIAKNPLLSTPNKIKKFILSGFDWGKTKTNQFVEDLKYHQTGFFGKALGEGLEEVAEEVVADLSKGIYELAGELGANTTVKDVNAFENALPRYAMSFFGGAIGGGIFYGVDVYLNGKFHVDQSLDEFIFLIRNGKTNEVLEKLKEWRDKGKLGDTNLSMLTEFDSKGNKVFTTALNKSDSQNEFVYNRLRETVLSLLAIIELNEANLNEDLLFLKMVMNEARFNDLKKYMDVEKISYVTSWQEDYQKAVSDVATLTLNYEKASETDTGLVYATEDEFLQHRLTDALKRGLTQQLLELRDTNLKKLKEKLDKAKEVLLKFNKGDYSMEYTEKLLFALDEYLNETYLYMTFDLWLAHNHDGKKVDDLSPAEINTYKEEYLKYRSKAMKLDLNNKYELFKRVEDKILPFLESIKLNLEKFIKFLEAIEKLKTLKPLLEIKFDDLFLEEETEESESYLKRNEEPFKTQRQILLRLANDALYLLYADLVMSIIDEAGGFIDLGSKRLLKLTLLKRNKDVLAQVLKEIQETMISDLKVVDETTGEFTQLPLSPYDENFLELISLYNGSNGDSLWETFKLNIIKSESDKANSRNRAINYILDFIWSQLDSGTLSIIGDSDSLTSRDSITEIIEGRVKELLDLFISEGDDADTALKKAVETAFSPGENNLLPENFFDYIDDDLLAITRVILEKMLEAYLTGADVLVQKTKTKDLEESATVQTMLQLYIAYFELFKNTIDDHPLILLSKEVDEKLKAVNPVLDLVRLIGLISNIDMGNLESVLTKLDENFDNVESIEDIVLTDSEKEAFEEVEYILKLAQAYIYATSSNPNNITLPFSHNTVLNEMAAHNPDVYKDWKPLPTLLLDIANAYMHGIDSYLFLLGIKDEQTGLYNINSWRGLSAKNEMNKIKWFIDAEKAWNSTLYDLFKINKEAFKFKYENKDIDLLEGFEDIPPVNADNKEALLDINKLLDLFYTNVLKYINDGWTYDLLLSRSKILEKICGLSAIVNLKLSNLNPSISYDKLTGYDKMVILLTAMALNSTDFYNYLKTRVESEKNIVPLTIQQWVSRVGAAYVTNPDLFDSALDYITRETGTKKSKIRGIFIAGNAGAGKSSVCAKNITETIKEVPDDELWLSAPDKDLTENLYKAIGKRGKRFTNRKNSAKSTDDLLSAIGLDEAVVDLVENILKGSKVRENLAKNSEASKYISIDEEDGSDLVIANFDNIKINKIDNAPKMLVIDEATHLSNFVLQCINKFCELNGTRLILIGDTKQKGFTGLGYNLDRETAILFRTPNLGISLRDNNLLHYTNLLKLEQMIEELSNLDSGLEYLDKVKVIYNQLLSIKFRAYQLDDINGDLIVGLLTDDLVQKMKSNIEEEEKKDKTDKPRIAYLGKYPSLTLTTLNKSGLKVDVFDSILKIQGREYDYLVVGLEFDLENLQNDMKLMNFLQELYTVISRAKKGSIIVDSSGKLKLVIGDNRIETSKSQAPDIKSYASEYIEKLLEILNKISKKDDTKTPEESTKKEITEPPKEKTELPPKENPGGKSEKEEPVDLSKVVISEEEFNPNTINFDENYYLVTAVLNNTELENGVKLSNLTLVNGTSQIDSFINLVRGKFKAIALISLSKSLFNPDNKSINNPLALSNALESIVGDKTTIPPKYIESIILLKEEKEESDDIKTYEKDKVEEPVITKQDLKEMGVLDSVYNFPEETSEVRAEAFSTEFGNPILCYGNATFHGMLVEVRKNEVTGKNEEFWIIDKSSKVVRDGNIFVDKRRKKVLPGDLVDLSKKLVLFKSAFLYKHTYLELISIDKSMKNIISEDEFNNMKFYLQVRPIDDEHDNFIRNTGFSKDKLGFGKKLKLVYAIVGKFKTKDGRDAEITLSLLGNPDSWEKGYSDLVSRIEQEIKKAQEKLKSTIILSEKDSLTKAIEYYTKLKNSLPDDIKAYSSFMLDLEEKLGGKPEPYEVEVPKEGLVFTGLTNLHKEFITKPNGQVTKDRKIVRLSRFSKAQLRGLLRRLNRLNESLAKAVESNGSKRAINTIKIKIEDTKKVIEKVLEMTDVSFRSLNPYAVVSDMYIYTPSSATAGLLGLDDSLRGKCNVVFVSEDPFLDKDSLHQEYLKQKTLRKSEIDDGIIDLKESSSVPRVRMVVLNNLGVSFLDLSNPYLLDMMTTDVTTRDGSTIKLIYPFKTNYMGARMFVGLWNFRANLLLFEEALKGFRSEIKSKFGDINLDDYLLLKEIKYQLEKGGESISQELKDWYLANLGIASFNEVSDLVDKFNERLSGLVKQFRLGYGIKNGAYVRTLTGNNLSNFYDTTGNTPINGIYLNIETFEKYSKIASNIFKHVLDYIVKCDLDPNKLLSVNEGTKNSFSKHMSLITSNNGQSILVNDVKIDENGNIIKGSPININFNSEVNNVILNAFSHIPAVLSKVFDYTTIRQHYFYADAFDDSDFYSIRVLNIDESIKEVNGKAVKTTVDLETKKLVRYITIPYQNIWDDLGIVEADENATVEDFEHFLANYEADDTLSNFFSFAFHGTLLDVLDRSNLRDSAALFPYGFFADPFSSSEILYARPNEKAFVKAILNLVNFGVDVSIGLPTHFIYLKPIKDSVKEKSKPKPEESKVDDESINYINNRRALVPGLSDEYTQVLEEAKDIDKDKRLSWIARKCKSIEKNFCEKNNLYLFEQNKGVVLLDTIIEINEDGVITLEQKILKLFKDSLNRELPPITSIKTDNLSIIIEAGTNTAIVLSRDMDLNIVMDVKATDTIPEILTDITFETVILQILLLVEHGIIPLSELDVLQKFMKNKKATKPAKIAKISKIINLDRALNESQAKELEEVSEKIKADLETINKSINCR